MAAIIVYWQIQSTAGSSTSSSQSSVKAQRPTLPPRPLNQSLSLFLSVSFLSPEPAEHNKPQIWASFTDFTPETHQCSALQQTSWSSTDLFEVGELDELHGHLRVLQLDGFAHSGFGMSRGQTDQSLQCSGCHRRGLRRTRRKEEEEEEGQSVISSTTHQVVTALHLQRFYESHKSFVQPVKRTSLHTVVM